MQPLEIRTKKIILDFIARAVPGTKNIYATAYVCNTVCLTSMKYIITLLCVAGHSGTPCTMHVIQKGTYVKADVHRFTSENMHMFFHGHLCNRSM